VVISLLGRLPSKAQKGSKPRCHLLTHAQARATSVTPNWDIASSCSVAGKKGLLLVEAKAHRDELKADDRSGATGRNCLRIKEAITEANQALNDIMAGWNLSHDNHYQLCNRFAWSWKVASLGVPVVLVYLGFLNATEMGVHCFKSREEWEAAVHHYAEGVVPRDIWGQRLPDEGVAIYPLIRSIDWPLDFKGDFLS